MGHRTHPLDSNGASRLGKCIREARTRLGMTQQELGTRIDLTDVQISRIERGIQTTDPERLVKLARSLNLNSSMVLRLAGFTVLADELARREDPEWAKRTELHGAQFSSHEVRTVQSMLERIRKLSPLNDESERSR
ncbi:MAG: helix-turn-helix domain-containing protein [Phycisphaerales bacterium]